MSRILQVRLTRRVLRAFLAQELDDLFAQFHPQEGIVKGLLVLKEEALDHLLVVHVHLGAIGV